jgi:predicted small metal-binding protein
MAKTVGCSDFNQSCEFRIIAGNDETQLIEDTATSHAMEYHREFAPDEPAMREAIRSQIRHLMQQAHMEFDPSLAR